MNQAEAEQFETLSNFQVGELEGGGSGQVYTCCVTAGDPEDEEMGRISEGYKY